MKGLELTATVFFKRFLLHVCKLCQCQVTVILQHGFGSVTKTQVYY